MRLVDYLKIIAFRHTKFGKPWYPFPTVDPIELATLILEIDRLKHTAGSIAEIGVARGMTTRFMCEHLTRSGCTNQQIFAIDTFQSFLDSDVAYEVAHRGKKKSDFDGEFSYNDFEVWKNNFSEFPFVKAIQDDCAVFDYATIAPIKLAFLDVDLYMPIKRALPRIYEHLCDGSIIMVDDVLNNFRYDGAYQAYMEFCNDRNMVPEILGNKCGVIRKLAVRDEQPKDRVYQESYQKDGKPRQ